MNSMQSIFSPVVTEALGWTIIHALWQGIIILAALLILLAILNRRSAQVRYFITFTALVTLLGWSTSTFINAYSYAQEKQEIKGELLHNPAYFKSITHTTNTAQNTNISPSVYSIKIVKIRAWFQRNFPIFLTIWLIGIGLFTVRLLGGLAYNRKLRSLQLLPFEEKWMEKLKTLARRLHITKEIQAYKSPHTTSPLTLGILKPIILFPIKSFSGLSEKEIEAIIAHELAHIVRHDYLFNIIQSVIEILFFYHPAIWIISNHIRTEREHTCDDIAIDITGDKVTYAKALAHAHIFSCQQDNLSMAFSKKKGSLLERIKRIQKQRVMKTNFAESLIAACIIISSIFLLSFTVGKPFNEALHSENYNNKDTTLVIKPLTPTPPVPPARTKGIKDSIMQALEKNIALAKEKKALSQEMEQAMEIALSENDQSLSSQIMEEINLALQDISFEEIKAEMNKAQLEIDQAIHTINTDSIQEEIQAALKEARKEIKQAAKESKKSLKEANDTKNIEAITQLSLDAAESGLEIANQILKNIDIDAIVETSLEAANMAIELAGDHIENLNIDSLAQAEYQQAQKSETQYSVEKELEHEKDAAELKKEMKALKEEMEKLKEELKEARKEKM